MVRHESEIARAGTAAETRTPFGAVRARAQQRAGLDIRELLRILRRRLRIVIATPLILAAVAMVYLLAVQPLYTATATILIDPRRAAVVDTGNQQVLSNFNTDEATIESQVMLVQSVAVLQRVVDTLKLTEDPEFTPQTNLFSLIRSLFSTPQPIPGTNPEAVAKARSVELLQKRLKVARQKSTFVVDINVSAWDAVKASAIANAIADAYFIEQVRSKYDATRIATDWLGRQIDGLRTRVVASEKSVAEFRATNNLQVAQGVTVNDQQISDLNNKLVEARAKTAETRAKYDQAQELAQRGRDAGSVAEALSIRHRSAVACPIWRIEQERGRSVIALWTPPPAGRLDAGPGPRYPAADRRGSPANPAGQKP